MTRRGGFSWNLGIATITGNLKPARHFIFNCTYLLSNLQPQRTYDCDVPLLELVGDG
jgi:hypothetical protein